MVTRRTFMTLREGHSVGTWVVAELAALLQEALRCVSGGVSEHTIATLLLSISPKYHVKL